MREVPSVAPTETSVANSRRQLSDITMLEWGNTSITKKSYVDAGFTAISAAGPDGLLDHFEWSGDGVVLSAIGARCGRCFHVSGKWTAIKNTIVIQGDPAKVNHKFLYYYLNDARKWKISGSGQPFITLKTARETAVPFPALEVQDEIVAELDKQFSRLDEAVANLQRVKSNLKRYKAAVLKAAVEGRLVETEASIAHREGRGYESGAELLIDLLKSRRLQWKKKSGYKEPASPDGVACGSLPEGWVWSTVEQLNPGHRPCAYGVLQPGDDLPNGVPFVRVGDINDGVVDLSEMKRIDAAIAGAYPRTKLSGGEVLLTLVGAIGRTAVVPPSLAGGNVARAVGVLPINELVDPHWVEIWFRNPAKILEMTSKSHEVARKTLNLEDVRLSAVAIPPRAEQVRIVSEVDRRMSIAREVEAEINRNMQRASSLRQATLAKVFAS